MMPSLINHPDKLRQPIDATGFHYDDNHRKSGCDIDFMVEHNRQVYVFYEVKARGVRMPLGQEMALERLADDLHRAGKKAVVLLCEHDVWNPAEPILLKDTIVTRYYIGGSGRWVKSKAGRDALEATRRFINLEVK